MSTTPSIETLKRALEIAEQIDKLETELAKILDGSPALQVDAPPVEAKRRRKKRTMSAESRARIAAAQRERWAKQKGTAA